MSSLLESLHSDEGKSRPPECLVVGSVLVLMSPSKLNTYRLPHQNPIGSFNLSESVHICMTAVESHGSVVLLLGDSEGSVTFLTEFCVPYKKQSFTSGECQPILKLKPSNIRKDEILAVSSKCLLLFPVAAVDKEDVPFSRLLPPPHDLTDALLLPHKNNKCLFDTLRETHMQKTEGPFIVTAGNGILFQVHTLPAGPSEWDLAKNVVSSVKSGLLRVFGGGDKEAPKKIETEKRITKLMGIKDAKKKVLSLEASPDGRFTAACDLQHRVELFDNDLGRLLHVWKGYHHARVAWIHSQATTGDPPVLLLAIYSPRRKKIEIWSPLSKARIAEFSVEEPGTFVRCRGEEEACSKFINLVSGEIFSFVVPMSSVHDPLMGVDKFKRTLHKFYRLNNDKSDSAEKYLKELIYLIRSAGSQHTMCSLLLELCQSATITTEQGIVACKALQGHGEISSAFIDKLLSIIDLKVHLESIQHSGSDFVQGSLDEFIVQHFPDNEVCDFSTDMDLSSPSEIPHISFGKFMSFVEINRFCLPEFTSLNGPHLLPFTYAIASGFLDATAEKTKELLGRACPELDLTRIFFSSATTGSLGIDNLGRFTPFIKSFWAFACKNSETYRLSAKNFFYHSSMNRSNLGIMRLWIGFTSEREPNEDLVRVSGLVRTYLLLKQNFDGKSEEKMTFDEVFNKGNGKLPAVLASWFVDAELDMDTAESFRRENAALFPLSLSEETFYAHLAWCLFSRQNSAPLKDLRAFSDIKRVLTEKIHTPVLKHRLSAVLWNNFAKGYVRTLLKLFKGPEFREVAPREMGVREDSMCEFFEFLHFIKTFDLYHWEDMEEEAATEPLIWYDDVSLVEIPLVGDLINRFVRSEEYEYMAGIYFQAVIVVQFMWQFRLGDVNPLSLFEPRDLDDIIFPTEERQRLSMGMRILRGFSGEIEKHRASFLEKASFRLVDLIQEAGEGGDALQRGEFDIWVTKYYTIAGYWNLRSKSKRYIMRDLYKAGYDSAGREMFEPVAFEQDELNELKSIACLRLSKILSQAPPATSAIVSSAKPELTNKLTFCEVFTKDLVDVPVRKTRDLFSLICSVDDDPEMLDCLSIVRSIQDADLE